MRKTTKKAPIKNFQNNPIANKNIKNSQINNYLYHDNIKFLSQKYNFLFKDKEYDKLNIKNAAKSQRSSIEINPLLEKEKDSKNQSKEEIDFKKEFQSINLNIQNGMNQVNKEVKDGLSSVNNKLDSIKNGICDLKNEIINGFNKLIILFTNKDNKSEINVHNINKSDDEIFDIESNKSHNEKSSSYKAISSEEINLKESSESKKSKIIQSSSSSEKVLSYKPGDIIHSGKSYNKYQTIKIKKSSDSGSKKKK